MTAKSDIPLEKTIVNRIAVALRCEGYPFLIKTHGAAYQVAGIPDILTINRNGRFVGLEVKRPVVGRATELQLRMLERINRVGGYAAIVHDVAEAIEAMERSENGEVDIR